MALKKFRPITPGQRHKVARTFDEITSNRPEKSLLSKKKKSAVIPSSEVTALNKHVYSYVLLSPITPTVYTGNNAA